MKKTMLRVALLSGAMCLSGCSSIFGGERSTLASAEKLNMAEIYHDYAVEELELGRKHVARGAYVSALEPLRRASRDPATAPTAYNAIGVAYAKLGREDIASRFFRLALRHDPQNESFAANLTRLQDQSLQQKHSSERAMLAAQSVPSAPSEVAVVYPVESPSAPAGRTLKPAFGANVVTTSGTGHLQRVSPVEVIIANHAQERRSRQAKADVAAQYPVHIRF